MPPRTLRKDTIALERIHTLIRQAKEIHPTNPQLAQRYTDIARKIAMRTRTHLPPEIRKLICRSCGALLTPGISSRTRIRQRREPHVTTTCLICGHVHRKYLRRDNP